MLSLKTRIVIVTITILAVVLCMFAWLVYRNAERDEYLKLEARLDNHAIQWKLELEEEAEAYREGPRLADPEELLDIGIDALPGLVVRLLDENRKPVIDDTILAALNDEALQVSLDGQSERGKFSLHGQTYIYLQVPVDIEDAEGEDYVGFMLQIGAPALEMDARLRGLLILFAVAIPTSLLLSALAAFLLVRLALKPLSSMVASAQRVSAERLDERIELPRSRDEVYALAKALNEMIGRIEAAFAAQRQFVANSSHELRTPLAVIRSELEFARKRVEDARATESIALSLEEIDRLALMCERLLLLAKLESAQRRIQRVPVRIDELMMECVQLLKRLAEDKRVTVLVDVQSAVEFPADPELLRAVFRNLLDNAIKYSPEGGKVEVGLSESSSPTRSLQISVRDDGPGISEADLPHIFDRFYRSADARADERGSGLGLSLAKMIVELHGGWIEAESRPEAGTEFRVALPGSMQEMPDS